MDNKFAILVDAGTDLPNEFYEQNDVDFIPMTYTIDGETYIDDAGQSAPYAEFYEKLRAGQVSTTSVINTDTYEQWFRKFLDEGRDLLVVTMSSGISSSYNAARLAAEEIAPSYPDRKLIVIDGLIASLGGGLLTHYAVRLRREGKTIDETAEWIERNKKHIQHIVTVEDLMFLQRGGRIGKGTAVVGSLIGIKPMIDVDAEGKLRTCAKKRGRKGALDGLVEWMGTLTVSKELDCIAISHGDCEADADYVVSKIKEKYKIGKVIKNYIGPVIGSHAGPGTIALFFYGKERV